MVGGGAALDRVGLGGAEVVEEGVLAGATVGAVAPRLLALVLLVGQAPHAALVLLPVGTFVVQHRPAVAAAGVGVAAVATFYLTGLSGFRGAGRFSLPLSSPAVCALIGIVC